MLYNNVAAHRSASSLQYTEGRSLGDLPAVSCRPRHWTSNSYFCNQSRNSRKEGCDFPKRLLRPLWKPSATLVVRVPMLSQCDHRQTGKSPRIHIRSKYAAEERALFCLHRTSDVETRRRLRSADSAMLVVPSTRRSTLGDRAFPVASARAWNSLPSSVRNARSLTTFRRELKTVLFRSSFDND